ncbi:MAG: LemA family protein [Candidatus Micrarchaeota archaeon]
MIVLICLGGAILLAGLFAILTFNNLISLKNRVDNAWSQIDVQLKRRYDLIPNLIETVKGYAKHEKETLSDITKYRAQLVTGTTEQKAQANNMLTGALKSLFAVAENYPQLKANENFKMLQEELAGTENKIAYVRTAYNDNVLSYNNAIQMFPNSIFANMFNFVQKTYFEAPAAERENIKVKF